MSGYEIVEFDRVPGVACPCGTAHRAFADIADFPCTLHRTHITQDAKLHHHRRQTEVYYVLDCAEGAQMQLNDEVVPVRPGTSILIRPGTRHRAIGEMTVLIVVWPKFDPEDEWIDE